MTDINEAIGPLVEGAHRVVPGSSVSVWLLGAGGEQFSLACAHGLPPASTPEYKLADSPLSRQALETGSAGARATSSDSPATIAPADAAFPLGIGEVVLLRLGSVGQPLGLLAVQTTTLQTLTSAQLTALQALAHIGSVVLAMARRVHDLERAEANRAQFMHITTHELRSPLAVSQTLIRNVVKGYAGPLTEKQQDVFRRISSQLDALESLVNDLLDLAASRSAVTASEPVLLNASIGRVVLLLQPRAEEKGVELLLRPSREELVVCATEDGLDRIFVNLVGNAVKYTPAGGRVTVSSVREDEHVIVTIVDTGIGIPAEGLTHLFEEFYRAPNVRAANIPGTGLGLAIVHELVQRFRGQVRVESEVGKGTIFTVSFPLGR